MMISPFLAFTPSNPLIPNFILPPPTLANPVKFDGDTFRSVFDTGAKFYALRPLYPLEKTLADINIDTVNPWGKTRDIEDLSNNNSTLDDLLAAAAKRNGREMKPNSQPEKGVPVPVLTTALYE